MGHTSIIDVISTNQEMKERVEKWGKYENKLISQISKDPPCTYSRTYVENNNKIKIGKPMIVTEMILKEIVISITILRVPESTRTRMLMIATVMILQEIIISITFLRVPESTRT